MMKKLFLLVCLAGLVAAGFSQPSLSQVSFKSSVAIFDLLEIDFQLGAYANPYDPEVIDVTAEFTGPDGQTQTVPGFYYEAYRFAEKEGYEVALRQKAGDGWKVRFTPDAAGDWTFKLSARDKDGLQVLTAYEGKAFAFQCFSRVTKEGFISKANLLFLKREAVVDQQKQYRSFFPVGPNIPWYLCADILRYQKPYGIYEYERYIDSLSGNANYMRVWLTRYQFLSLYGPEQTIRTNGLPTVYFDSMLNQKDAAEFDHIVCYAADHGITIMPCIFTFGDFMDEAWAVQALQSFASMPSAWSHNPYHTILGLQEPVEFFTNPEARRISKNLLRYIVARWGYATNIMCWELWNEVANVFWGATPDVTVGQAIGEWHSEMASYLHSIDQKHPVTTSLGNYTGMEGLLDTGFGGLDLIQEHYYDNIQKARSRELMSYVLLQRRNRFKWIHPAKPFLMGEYGLNSSEKDADYVHKDPHGFDLHNTTWASLFSASMGPASFWYWQDLSTLDLFRGFRPMKVFAEGLPLLSAWFTPATTGTPRGNALVFPNNIQTFYMVNETEDTIYGWCQDTAFSYQALRRLTEPAAGDGHFKTDNTIDTTGYLYTLDPSKRPAPSSKKNTITFTLNQQPVGTRYAVRWFDTETGLELKEEATTTTLKARWFQKQLDIEMPSSIRDVDGGVVNNTFGDAVFIIYKE